jgi:hypothetical protein
VVRRHWERPDAGRTRDGHRVRDAPEDRRAAEDWTPVLAVQHRAGYRRHPHRQPRRERPAAGDQGARIALSGYRDQLARAKDPAARARKAQLAVPARLRDMLATLDRDTLIGKRDAALLLLGFASAARVSELWPSTWRTWSRPSRASRRPYTG